MKLIIRQRLGRRQPGGALCAALLLIAIATLAVGCGSGGSATGPGGTKKVNLRLDWVAQGYQAPFYVALGKGYYKDEGLDVNIEDGRGTSTTIKTVANGSDQFGFGQLSEMASGVLDEDIPLKAVAGIFQRMPDAVFARDGSGISSLSDLPGKSVVSSPSDSSRSFFPALAQANGFSEDDVQFLNVSSESKVRTFLAGQGDAMLDFASDKYAVEHGGVKVKLFPYADNGVNVISQGIFTSNDMFANEPGTVQEFVRASMRGLRFTMQNPKAAVKYIEKYRPGAEKPAQSLAELKASLPLITPPGSKSNPLGFMPPDEWKQSIALLHKYGGLENASDPTQVYTNRFVATG